MAVQGGDEDRRGPVRAHLVDVAPSVEERLDGPGVTLTRRVQQRGHAAHVPHLLPHGEGFGGLGRLLFLFVLCLFFVLCLLFLRRPGGELGVDLLAHPVLLATPEGFLQRDHVHHRGGERRVGPARNQRPDRLDPVLCRGEDERRLPCPLLARVHVGPVLDERGDRFRITRGGRQVQRGGSTAAGRCRRIATRFEQRAHHRPVAGPAGQVQGRVLRHARDRVQAGARVDEHACHLQVAPVGRPVKGGHAVALGGVYVGPLLEQRAHRPLIAAHGRVRHRRVRRRRRRNQEGQDQGGNDRSRPPRVPAPGSRFLFPFAHHLSHLFSSVRVTSSNA